MENTAYKNLLRILEQPYSVSELTQAISDVDSDNLPNLLKKPFDQLSLHLSKWIKCSQEVSNLTTKLAEVQKKNLETNYLVDQYHSKLSETQGLENLSNLLMKTQELQPPASSDQALPSIDTWQQKKKNFENAINILNQHIKYIAKNMVVELYLQLPKTIAELRVFGIHVTKDQTVERIGKLLTRLHTPLEKCHKDIESLNKLSFLFSAQRAHYSLLSRINRIRENNSQKIQVEINIIRSQLQELQPIVNTHQNLFEVEKANFGSLASANQYISGLIGTAFVKWNLVDKNYLEFQSLQTTIRKYLSLSRRKDELETKYNNNLQVLAQLEKRLDHIKTKLKEKDIEGLSSHDVITSAKQTLGAVDPSYNYNSIANILMLEQQQEALKKTTEDKIKRLDKIIYLLEKFNEELSHIQDIRNHHKITATNEALVDGYPWKSSISLTSEETSLLLVDINTAMKPLEVLCLYESKLAKATLAIQQNQEISGQLQGALNQKKTRLLTIEKRINKAISVNLEIMKRIQDKNQKLNHSQKVENNDNTPENDLINSTNLWQDYLRPLIVNQPDILKSWLTRCCNPSNKEILSKKQQLQFDQLCQDIYIELKYNNNEENKVLLAYEAIFKQQGLQNLILLKPAIPIGFQRNLPTLRNKQVFQAIQLLRRSATMEQKKIAGIIEQTCSQLHYLAWQVEQRGVSSSLIEELQPKFAYDPRYHCLKQSKYYASIVDWFVGICQAIKQFVTQPSRPIYHYGLFSKKPAYMEYATHISQEIAACA